MEERRERDYVKDEEDHKRRIRIERGKIKRRGDGNI